MALSLGHYGESSFKLLNIDFENCQFNELFEQELEDDQYGEGMTITKINGNDVALQFGYLESEITEQN